MAGRKQDVPMSRERSATPPGHDPQPAEAVQRGSRVLRADATSRRLTEAEWRARHDAEAVRRDAETRARALIAAAEAEVASIRSAARAAGLAEAHAGAAATLLAAARARDAWLAEGEGTLRALVIEVARQVLGAELETHPRQVVRLVENALDRERRGRALTVHVSPEDLDVVYGAEPALRDKLALPESVHIEVDPSLQRGDCVVTSHLGSVDARLETQLKALREALEDTARAAATPEPTPPAMPHPATPAAEDP
jgi:flagellar biosynthesis/type III secretory pathway protein FliH